MSGAAYSMSYTENTSQVWSQYIWGLVRELNLEYCVQNALLHVCLLDNLEYGQLLYSWIYSTGPLRKHVAYKQATRGPTAQVLSKGLGNEDKVPCPRALLPLPADSNWGPHSWECVVLSMHWATTAPQDFDHRLKEQNGKDDPRLSIHYYMYLTFAILMKWPMTSALALDICVMRTSWTTQKLTCNDTMGQVMKTESVLHWLSQYQLYLMHIITHGTKTNGRQLKFITTHSCVLISGEINIFPANRMQRMYWWFQLQT